MNAARVNLLRCAQDSSGEIVGACFAECYHAYFFFMNLGACEMLGASTWSLLAEMDSSLFTSSFYASGNEC